MITHHAYKVLKSDGGRRGGFSPGQKLFSFPDVDGGDEIRMGQGRSEVGPRNFPESFVVELYERKRRRNLLSVCGCKTTRMHRFSSEA